MQVRTAVSSNVLSCLCPKTVNYACKKMNAEFTQYSGYHLLVLPPPVPTVLMVAGTEDDG